MDNTSFKNLKKKDKKTKWYALWYLSITKIKNKQLENNLHGNPNPKRRKQKHLDFDKENCLETPYVI